LRASLDCITLASTFAVLVLIFKHHSGFVNAFVPILKNDHIVSRGPACLSSTKIVVIGYVDFHERFRTC